MKKIERRYIHIFILIVISMTFSACSFYTERFKTEPKKAESKKAEKKISLSAILTPIQKCAKEKDKYNLIVNAPIGSRVRILNIKPIYKDCIALKSGRYHIEVTKPGFKKHKEWINLNSDREFFVELSRVDVFKADTKREIAELEKAGYNSSKLKLFIKKYPRSNKSLVAKNRLGVIKHKFKHYSPSGVIKSNNCTGFYPKKLVELNLKIKNTNKNLWESISWNGECKKGLMSGRGTLHFKSKSGLHVELKGKMKNGFFEGKVYNHSKTEENTNIIKDKKKGYMNIELKNRFDFIFYQE